MKKTVPSHKLFSLFDISYKDLPEELRDTWVEVTVSKAAPDFKPPERRKPTGASAGILHHLANPALIPYEELAPEVAMARKYGVVDEKYDEWERAVAEIHRKANEERALA
ncbi:MAG: hypothetical protein LBM98_02895 [Oscillospiraceae bacterium]|nr:hypothetical protein [Oscillospiraceae bacterium]